MLLKWDDLVKASNIYQHLHQGDARHGVISKIIPGLNTDAFFSKKAINKLLVF